MRAACQRFRDRPSRPSTCSTSPMTSTSRRLRATIGGSAASARFLPKSTAPSYLQYATPPVVVDGEALGIGEIDGFRPRLKFFDYGVVSRGAVAALLRATGPISIAISQSYIENEALEERAPRQVCRKVCRSDWQLLITDGAHDIPRRRLPGVLASPASIGR